MLTATKAKVSPGKLLINGQWSESNRSFDTFNPATGEVLTQVADAGAQEVDQAVAAARKAFDDVAGPWRKMSASERGKVLWRIADLIEKNIEELAELETLNNGKPIFESRYVDMPMVADVFRYFAGWATKIHGETVNTFSNAFTYTLREPIGVVGAIVAWNFPLLLASWKLGPALACGNTVVLKPAEQTPLTALRFGELTLDRGGKRDHAQFRRYAQARDPGAGRQVTQHCLCRFADGFGGKGRSERHLLRQRRSLLRRLAPVHREESRRRVCEQAGGVGEEDPAGRSARSQDASGSDRQ
jgi:delta 1-pyrroline-5-carboxylate dehydrogenase